MGPRRPWDEIGLQFPAKQEEPKLVEIPELPEKADRLADLRYIGQKTLFGVVVIYQFFIGVRLYIYILLPCCRRAHSRGCALEWWMSSATRRL